MLALTIREKNGEERQLIFEKEEVTIGRATGSDIVLPRSNISKRHARLVDKHDKVVIVDLRSTNGTYVNGRRITAPELLTYEDKVYIGDFVIRLSRPAEQHASQRMTTPYTASPTPEGPRTGRGPTAAVDAPMAMVDEELDEAPLYEEPKRSTQRSGPPAPPPDLHEADEDRTRAVMAMPDDDEELPPPPKKTLPQSSPHAGKKAEPAPPLAKKAEPVPPPKKAEPPPPKLAAPPAPPAPPSPPPAAKKAEPPKPAHEPTAPKARTPAQKPPSDERAYGEEPPTMSVAVPAQLKRAALHDEPQPETLDDGAVTDPWAEWNQAIQTVVERIERDHQTVPPDDAESIAADAVSQAIDAGEIAAETEREALTSDVVAELVGLGPITDALADDTVLAIYMNGPKSVFVDRGTGVHEANGRVFATIGSYRRTIAHLAGILETDEVAGIEEIALPDGATVRVVGAGLGHGPLVVWRRAAREVPLLPDLVAEGMLDQAQSHQLTQAVVDGKSLLVCGVPSGARSALVSAISAEIGLDRRVVVVGDRTQVAVPHGNAARLGARSLFAGVSLAGLEPDILVFEQLDGSSVSEWVEACLMLGKPVVALSPEPNAERALRRLGLLLELAQLPASPGRGGVIVGEAVDVVVSLRTQADGTVRVDRLQECESNKDTKDGFALRVSAKR